jgi:peptide/nickel transport system permease protein
MKGFLSTRAQPVLGAIAGILVRLARRRTALLAGAILLPMVLAAVLAPQVSPYDPLEMDYDSVLVPPSRAHPLGTDELGRDLLSRLLYGFRASLVIAFTAVVGSTVVGSFLGLIGAIAGGSVDHVTMRFIDAILGFPRLLLALLILAVLGPGLVNAILALAVIGIPAVARMMRARVLVEKEKEYVLAARAIGATNWRVTTRHMLPNAAPTLMVVATLNAADAIHQEAALTFLGLGVQAPHSSLGILLKRGFGYLTSPWYILYPGLMVVLIVWSLNTLGDALNAAIDPTS